MVLEPWQFSPDCPSVAQQRWYLGTLAKQWGRPVGALLEMYQTHHLEAQPQPTLDVQEFLQQKREERQWLVAGFLPLATTALLVADGGAGKTLLAYDLVKSIATGASWNGFPVRQAKCLILQSDEPEMDTQERLWIAGYDQIPQGRVFIKKPEWFKLLVQMVDQQTQSILVLYDDAQNLYQKTRQRRFSFKSVGIKAQGRTTILKVNYRNTAEVLALAYEFAKDVMTPSENSAEEDEPVLIAPQSVGRHGSIPELIQLPCLNDEIQYIGERSRQFHERGVPWEEIAILYRSNYIGEKIFSYFQKENIPVDWLGKDLDSRFFNPSKVGVKVLTMHSSKGLEFPVVFIAGLGTLPNKNTTLQEEARLLYVAMTRSTETLILTYSQESEFVNKMKSAYSKVAS